MINRNEQPRSQREPYSSGILLAAIISLIVSLPIRGFAEQGEGKAMRIEPDPVLQTEIRGIAEASNEQELDDRLDQIKTLVGRDYDLLVPQLLHYVAHDQEAKAKMAIGLILERLHIPKPAVVSALVPHLDHPNLAIQKTVHDLLHHHEDRSATRPPDFSSYRAIIEAAVRAGDEPPPALVRFMYASDPGAALLAMMRGHQLRDPDEIKPILWGQHRVAEMLWKRRYGFIKPTEVEPEALRQLEVLSRHDRYWVRLYAAEMCRRHAELRLPETRARLEVDVHPLVREAILAAKPVGLKK